MQAKVFSALNTARAQRVEVKLQRAQSFFESLTAEQVACLRGDPQIGSHLTMLARELLTLASAVGVQPTSIEEEERQIA